MENLKSYDLNGTELSSTDIIRKAYEKFSAHEVKETHAANLVNIDIIEISDSPMRGDSVRNVVASHVSRTMYYIEIKDELLKYIEELIQSN